MLLVKYKLGYKKRYISVRFFSEHDHLKDEKSHFQTFKKSISQPSLRVS
jgi:hypothetical protein